jgi:hypothetical protein
MSEVTRQELITALNEGWGSYVPRFRQFSEQERAAFLQAQGYARLADLLGHVVAWWEQALQTVPNLLEDPTFQTPDVDVDKFNAEAVSRFSELDEDSLVCSFLNLRSAWLDLVNDLPDKAFQDSRVRAKLHIELVGHLAEHAIDTPPA